MYIYLVIKVGIYNHDIFGAFEKKRSAIDKANMLSKMENDDYHTFDVVRMTLDTLQSVNVKEYYGLSCIQDTVYSVRKVVLDKPEPRDGYDWNLNLLNF